MMARDTCVDYRSSGAVRAVQGLLIAAVITVSDWFTMRITSLALDKQQLRHAGAPRLPSYREEYSRCLFLNFVSQKYYRTWDYYFKFRSS